MQFWRLTPERWSAGAFSGEGGIRFSGGWNPKGVRLVYTSEHLSLALLELLVNMDAVADSERYVAIRGEIPDHLEVGYIELRDLPTDWRDPSRPGLLQRIGRDWIVGGRYAALSVPSAVVPQERNVLLNPEHPDFARITIGPPESFSFDARLR